MKNLFYYLLIICLLPLGSIAQNNTDESWYGMILKENVDFREVQKAFYNYVEKYGEENTMHFKQFKRWEYLMETRLDENGYTLSPDYNLKEYYAYRESHPQKKNNQSYDQWTNLGPLFYTNGGGYVGNGRINSIATHPKNMDIVYIGAPAGGLWKSTDGGRTWFTHTDGMPTLGVSAIIIDSDDPDILYIGTGDRDGGDAPGVGVYKSTDAGETFTLINEGMGNHTVNMMYMNPDDHQFMYAATNGGVFLTTNGGTNWELRSPDEGNFRDLKVCPGDVNIIYTTKDGKFYRSEDMGRAWTQIDFPSTSRMVIGVTPKNDSIVYVGSASGGFDGLHISRDYGKHFTLQSDSPNIMGWNPDGSDLGKSQAWYDFCLSVHPESTDTLMLGGINMWRSFDGGVNWEICSHWYGAQGINEVHADQHTLDLCGQENRLYLGNDGGIYYTDDWGGEWTEITSGLPIGQIYKIGQSATNKYKTLTGFQDNGSNIYLGDRWTQIGGGDGFECAIDHEDDSYSYHTIYYGDVYRRKDLLGERKVAGNGVGQINESGAWVTPFALLENDANSMVLGMKNIWITHNIKSSNVSSIKWTKISSGLAGRNDQNMRVLEHSPADSNLLYAARYDNKLFRTDNLYDHPVWVDLSSDLPFSNSSITDLECHPRNQNVLYMTQHNMVFKSSDKGKTWTNISGTLPNVSISTIVFDITTDETLYVGTDLGVYYLSKDMDDWADYSTGLPVSVRNSELEIYYNRINPEEKYIRVGTYGRGLWESPLPPASFLIPPGSLQADAGNSYVNLSWTAPLYASEVVEYNIYRDEELIGTIPNTAFKDTLVENDHTYRYYVTCEYAGFFNGESAASVVVDATPLSPITVPYSQDFENGMAGWSIKASTLGFQYGTAEELNMGTGNDSYFFGINSVEAGEGVNCTDYATSPEIDLSTYSNVVLSFDYVLRRYMNYDHLYVMYRFSKDEDWQELQELDVTGNWESWTNIMIPLPEELLVQNVQLAVYYTDSNEYAWGAGFDNFSLSIGSAVNRDNLINSLMIYPNPNHGAFNVDIHSNTNCDLRIEVFNNQGQQVLNTSHENIQGVHKEKLNLSHLPKGIYMLRIFAGNDQYSKKIMIQ